MKTIQKPVIVAAFALLATVSMLCGCNGDKKTVQYEYAAISRGTIENTVSATGTLDAESKVGVQAPAAGIIDAVYAAPGERVAKGQILAEVNASGNPAQRQIAAVYSPIDGIVFDRAVTVGSPVLGRGAPSATTLFTIASGLTDMKITSSIGELDIASIREGQEVRVTLQALPGRGYTSKVAAVNLAPAVTDNVVSYTVISRLTNTDGALRPGMTCALQFILQKDENALVVPNAALRFTPDAAAPTQTASTASGGSQVSSITSALTGGKAGGGGGGVNAFGHPTGPSRLGGDISQTEGEQTAAIAAPQIERTLWYTDDSGKPASIQVYAGISDGLKTAISPVEEGRELEGLRIILREAE